MFKRFKTIFLLFFLLTAILFWSGDFVMAQAELGTSYVDGTGLQIAAESDPRAFIAEIIRYVLTFVGLVAVGFIIYGGFLWMTSNGDPSRVDKAKKTLISAVIGLIIILASFAIVTFVINTSSGVIGIGCDPPCESGTFCCRGTCCTDGMYCCSSGCSAVPCYDPDPHPNIFRLVNVSPIGDNVIRNARIRLTFNRQVDETTMDDATVRITNGGVAVSGDLEYNGRRIDFIPDGDCGVNDCDAVGCFDAGAPIHVEVQNLWSESGLVLSQMTDPDTSATVICGTLGACQYDFTVGEVIDCVNPRVSLDINQVCRAVDNELYALSSDDSEIFDLTFYIDDGAGEVMVGSVANALLDNPARDPFNTRGLFLPVLWDGTSALNDTVDIRVVAQDLDSHTAQRSSSFTLRPEHCCNDFFDDAEGETGTDCGGPCAACDGAACGASMTDDCTDTPGLDCHDNDDRCSSRFCDCLEPATGDCQDVGYGDDVTNCCICQSAPVIDWIDPQGGFCWDDNYMATDIACLNDTDCTGISGLCATSTPNGAVGNFVTIHGRNFGTASGTVDFGGVDARLASSVNPACTLSWTDREIIVEVPVGAGSLVTVTEGTSGNDYQDELDGFLLNNIIRPGLCGITPVVGTMNTILTYQGIRLNGVSAYFGNVRASTTAFNNNFASNITGTAQVPNLRPRRTTTFVADGNIASNFLNFQKLPEPYSGPMIVSFDPASSTVGQYITIQGTGFGTSRGSSQVFFDTEEADYDFPEVCADSVWSDNQVIVKAPDMADGLYLIVMDIDGVPELIDTSQLNSAQFELDRDLELRPSLCRIRPTMAPNDAPVFLWGEYFDISNPGSVRFQLGHDQAGGSWYMEDDANRIDTVVHMEAASGPVRVVNDDGVVGNGLNLEVGSCFDAPNPDLACGGLCCPVSSYRAGRCASDDPLLGGNDDTFTNVEDCFMQIKSSVYEWTFDTTHLAGLGEPCKDLDADPPVCNDGTLPDCDEDLFCDPDTRNVDGNCTCQAPGGPADSCQGLSENAGACLPGFCPNAAGQCSPLAGIKVEVGIACDATACNTTYDLCNDCSYNILMQRCADNLQAECSLAQTFDDVMRRPRTGYCADYGGVGHWHINTNLSCPTGWRMLMGNVCVFTGSPDGLCDYCTAGWDCQDDNNGNDGLGLCAIQEDICPRGSVCEDDECQQDNSQCECCCEIDQDERDCCAFEDPNNSGEFIQLECAGECGDPEEVRDFGHCTGCVAAGPDQADMDAACNCEDSTGRYCDSVADVCRDCAQLSDTNECSNHDSVCCVDADSYNDCRGGEGTTLGNPNSFGYTMTALGGDSSLAYCSYYECDNGDGACSIDIGLGYAVASSTSPIASHTPLFLSTITCANQCTVDGPAAGASCYSEIDQSCTLICAAGYTCIGETGCVNTACAAGDDSCACCCNPFDDQCTGLLTCEPNISPCSSPAEIRGLCCGCSMDADCVAVGSPVAIGCGLDSCCRLRPNVVTDPPTIPADEAIEICRNAIIEAEFDQLMNPSSFASNMIVVGDYAGDPCPEGTQYLAIADYSMNKSWFKRLSWNIFDRISGFLPAKIVNAFSEVYLDRNYCAIPGAISGYNTAAGTTKISFEPTRLMDPHRLHFAIIKGDDNLDDNIQDGVLSAWSVGMNSNNSPQNFSNTFNGITYQGAYIWSFTTMGEQAENNGVCTLEAVRIEPSSYLFFTTNDNLNEEVDTDPNHESYDSEPDVDKEFRALAISERNQTIAPVAGYDWDWSWYIGDTTLIATDTAPALSPRGAKQLYQAQEGRVDGRTQLIATINVLHGESTYGGDGLNSAADLYVFLCDNPWPPVDYDGNWAPWTDTDDNCACDDGSGNCTGVGFGGLCSDGSGNCYCRNTNYELYYCRDTGAVGTYDDLPAINSNNVVVRGQGDLSCSIQPGDCTGADLGDPCDPPDSGGICQYLLKETFYLREVGPIITTSITVTSLGIGQTANVLWAPVADPNVRGYRIYWGEQSEDYDDFIEVRNDGFISDMGELTNVTCDLTATFDCSVADLDNNRTYFFNLTSYTEAGAESDYYGEEYIFVEDTIGLDAPDGFTVEPGNQEVEVNWDVRDGAASYRVYYGTYSGVYGDYEDLDTGTAFILSPFNNNQLYYFVVTAFGGGQESVYSDEESAMPVGLLAPTGFIATPGDSQATLDWNEVIDAVSYRVYHGSTAGTYDNYVSNDSDTSLILSSLANGQTYYFAVTVLDRFGIESAYSVEREAMPVGPNCGDGTCDVADGECGAGCTADCDIDDCCEYDSACNDLIGEDADNCESDCGGTAPPLPPPPPPPGP